MANHDVVVNITARAAGVNAAVNSAKKAIGKLAHVSVHGNPFSGIQKSAGQTKASIAGVSSALDGIKGKIAGVFAAGSLIAFGKSALKAAANVEVFKKGLEFQIGIDQTNLLIDNIKKIGESSAYDASGLLPLAKQWINIGDNAESAVKKMQTIVDIGSAFGLTSEQIAGANLALTQMSMAGKIGQQDMMQLLNAGIPAWTLLSEKMGIPVQQLKDMSSQGQLTEDAINTLFEAMAEKGAGAADSRTNTLMGKFSNLEETVNNSMSDIGELIAMALDVPGVLDTMSDMVDGIKGHLANIKEAAQDAGVGQAIANELESVSPAAGKMANTVIWGFNQIKDAVKDINKRFDENKDLVNEIAYFGPKIAEAAVAVYTLEKAWLAVKAAIELAQVAQAAFYAFCKRTPWGFLATVLVAVLLVIIDNWDKVSAAAQAFWDKACEVCSGVANSIDEYIGGALRTIKQDWDTLVQAFSHPIDFVINRTEHISRTIDTDEIAANAGYGEEPEYRGGINGGPMRLAAGGIVGGQIPALANGGTANSGTLARIGEAGPEAVIPLKDEVLAKIGEAMYRASVKRQNLESAIRKQEKANRGQNLSQEDQDAQQAAIDAQKAQMDAEDMLNELQQKIVGEKGTRYQGKLLSNKKDLVDMRKQIAALAVQGADPAIIKQLTEAVDEYKRVVGDNSWHDQMQAIRQFAAQARQSYAEATHDYDGMAQAEYEATLLQLAKERRDKEKELMQDANDEQTRRAIAQYYEGKQIQALEKYQKAVRDAHSNRIDYLKEEGQLSAIVADEMNNGAAWDSEQYLSGTKSMANQFVEYAQVLHEGWTNYAAFISQELYGTMTDSMTAFIKGTRSAMSVIQDFGRTVLNTMAKIAAQRLAASWMGNIMGMIGGGSSPVSFSAGNDISLGSAIPFAKGGIVTAPTLAMIGEAGANEAVIPLNQKNLSAIGSGNGGVVVNITNKTSDKVQVQNSSYNEDIGKWVLDVVVDGASRNRGGFGANLKTALGGV